MDLFDGVTRRHALAGLAIGAGIPALAACGEEESGGEATPSGSGASPSESSSGSPSSSPSEAADGIAATSDVPVGGGTILADEKVVLTQPTAGEIKAFDATCTHQGCIVSGVTTSIDCECHGSRFSLTDGSVEQGPATSPLAEKAVSVKAGRITLS